MPPLYLNLVLKIMKLNPSLEKDYLTAIHASIEAGKRILEVYHTADFNTDFKADDSPLTAADLASNQEIMNHLQKTDIPVISEEQKMVPYPTRSQWNRLWMVDPLDGTKEFIKRNGEFTVNIALIENQRAIFGVIYVPVSRELYIGDVSANKSIKLVLNEDHDLPEDFLSQAEELKPVKAAASGIQVVGSRSHMNQDTLDFIETLKKDHAEIEIVSKGSSLKFCLVAEGLAHVYPRYAPTMEWDTAAGQAICEAVGLQVLARETGQPLLYNREDMLNGHFLVKHT